MSLRDLFDRARAAGIPLDGWHWSLVFNGWWRDARNPRTEQEAATNCTPTEAAAWMRANGHPGVADALETQ